MNEKLYILLRVIIQFFANAQNFNVKIFVDEKRDSQTLHWTNQFKNIHWNENNLLRENSESFFEIYFFDSSRSFL